MRPPSAAAQSTFGDHRVFCAYCDRAGVAYVANSLPARARDGRRPYLCLNCAALVVDMDDFKMRAARAEGPPHAP